MRKIFLYLFIISSCLILGCEGADLEGIDPINSVPSGGAINNLKSATAAVNGLYDDLQDGTLVSDGYLFLAQIYSDEADFTGTFPTRFEFATLNVSTSNGTNANVFSDFYQVINIANNILELLPQVEDPGLTPDIVNNFLAEARFARALCYFYLTNYYGDVPLILSPTVEVGEVLNVSNSPKADINKQIIDDLTFAETNLTNTNNQRATSAAASALLARVFLYEENWSDALNKAETVLGADFDLTQFEYMGDVIMSLGFTAADGNILNFWYGPSELGGRHDVEPSAKFLASYEAGDLRKDLSVDDALTRANVPFVVKYPSFSAGNSGTATDPVFLFRYAEQLLIAAEAAAELGDFTKATGYINQVRARAGLSDVTLDANNYLDLILQERLIELSFEGAHRYLDLRRTGRAAQEIDGYTPCHDIWPIPQREIDRNPNLNQNNCCNC